MARSQGYARRRSSPELGATTAAALILLLAGACSHSDHHPAPQTYSVSGVVNGLSGGSLTLQLGGGDNLTVTGSGSFTFATHIQNGAIYTVSVLAQPANPSQTCTAGNNSGVIAGSNVNDVVVNCATRSFVVGGTVAGLSGTGLVLQNGGEQIRVDANGRFNFLAPVLSGGRYDITLASSPVAPIQTCAVDGGSGVVADAPVSSPAVTCITHNPRFAYSLNSESISWHAVDAGTGQLRPLGFTAVDWRSNVASDRNQRFTYVIANLGTGIRAFARNPRSGQVAEIAGSPYPTGMLAGPVDPLGTITLHPGSRFLYAASSARFGDKIAGYSIDAASGALSPLPGSPFAVGTRPQSITIDPSGKFGYTWSLNTNDLRVYAIDPSTGALTEVPNSLIDVGEAPASLTFDNSGRFIYVPTIGHQRIFGYQVTAGTGLLAPIPGSAFVTDANPSRGKPMFHPNGKFLYVRTTGTPGDPGSLAAFSIDRSTGALTAIGAPHPVGIDTFLDKAQWIDPAGRFIYVANRAATPGPNSTGSVSIFSVDSQNGALTEIAGSPLSVSPGPFSITGERSGRYIYVSSNDGTLVHTFLIDPATGVLTASRSTPRMRTRGAPWELGVFDIPDIPEAVRFTSRFAYTANRDDNTISGFSADPRTGVLASGSTFTPIDAPSTLAIHARGNLLFAASQATNSLFPFAIDSATGTLKIGTGLTTGSEPVATATEIGSRFLFVANKASHTIESYDTDPLTGELARAAPAFVTSDPPVAIAPDPTGRFLFIVTDASVSCRSIATDGSLSGTGTLTTSSGAIGIEVDPTGRYAYVIIGTANGAVGAYSIDASTGALTAVATAATGSIPMSMAIEPTGRFAYVVNSASNDIAAFAINPQSGALTEIVPRIPAATTPVSVRIDLSGRYAYVATRGSNAVLAYSINDVSGALSPVAPVAAPTGNGPTAIVVSADIN